MRTKLLVLLSPFLLILLLIGGSAAYAVCTDNPNSYINSNNGALIVNDGSYKLRALRAYVMKMSCQSSGHNVFTCSGDTCTQTNGGVWVAAKDCYDLPSCAAWNCRSCRIKSNLPNENDSVDLRYKQGYETAKFISVQTGAIWHTAHIGGALPSYLRAGE